MAETSSKSDYLIIGAGVFGLTTAIELKTRHPELFIRVLDPGPIPHRHAASNDISKVLRMDYGFDEHYMGMMEECFPLWRKWNEEWKEEVYFESGLITVVDEIKSGSYEMANVETMRKRGHQIDLLDPTEFKKRFPVWAGSHEGYFNKLGGWARSGRVVEHLHRIAKDLGIEFAPGKVDRLSLKTPEGETSENSICEGVFTTEGAHYVATTTVVAAGAFTPSILPQVKHMMWPTAQPIFHFEIEHPEKYPVDQFPIFVSKGGFYGFPIIEESMTTQLAPRMDKTSADVKPTTTHRLKIGQHGPGWKIDSIDDDTLSELWSRVGPGNEQYVRRWLAQALPELKDAAAVYTRLCMYCDTFDGSFLIDYVPQVTGLVVASGGSGHGFKFTPILGTIIADVIEHKENKYKARFAWRSVVEGKREAARSTKSSD